jgi:hypothetical protein
LTAITGDPALAKMFVYVAPGSELTGTAAFDPLTRSDANRATASSAYLAGAATGK